MPKHPMQDIITDEQNVIRFRQNDIIRYLIDNGSFDLNKICILCNEKGFSNEDQEQLAQLIGYSISGYSDLSYVSDKSYNKAERRAGKMFKNTHQ